MSNEKLRAIKHRFRGFLPVIVDIETSGVNYQENAILELAAVLVLLDADGVFRVSTAYHEHVLPFEGAVLDPDSLEFNKIDPFHPLRLAKPELQALQNIILPINQALKAHDCQRAVLVGHNAWFDLLFLNTAIKRNNLKSPFHKFTCFDTATLSGFFYGQTVLAKAMLAAKIPFDVKEAHSALYDAQKTAELFCHMLNTNISSLPTSH
jgi:ribonuclease T